MTDTTKPTLKPCPFCGGEATLIDGVIPSGSAEVHCFNDKCMAMMGHETVEQMVSEWNTRSEPTLKQACIKCGYLSDVEIIDSHASINPTDAQIEAAAQAIEPLWHDFCKKPAEIILDGSAHESFVKTLAKVALIAAGDV